MEHIARRLARLEARTPPPPRARLGHVSGAEIRALEAHIRRLESGADEALTSPVIKSVEPDNETAAVVRKIEWLERIERASEGGVRWT